MSFRYWHCLLASILGYMGLDFVENSSASFFFLFFFFVNLEGAIQEHLTLEVT